VDSPTLPLRSSRAGALELVVCEGATTQRILVDRDLTIGRGDDADVRVGAASVSRVHARLRVGPPVTVEHAGATNPTVVNGKKLAAGQVVEIEPGGIVVVGDVQIVLRRAHTQEAAAPSVPERSMARVWKLVELAGPSDLSILVLGETGVGKEVVAQKIHAVSPRSGRPMLAINCAALHESTLESELFGHEAGAFTAATSTKPGLFEAASGSSVLLDEVGDLPLGIQAKVLRALDAREIMRLGAVKPKPIDVRVIAATHRDLTAMVDEKTFRADLFYRLDGLTIHVPPLRDRPEEIVPLAREIVRGACQGKKQLVVDDVVASALRDHAWPGNVRELKKVMERAVVLAGGGPLTVAHLQLKAPPVEPSDFKTERERAERRSIERALEQSHGNQTRAAEILGISRRTLVDRLGRYGIQRRSDR
jgi:two-component system response regulator AtoC